MGGLLSADGRGQNDKRAICQKGRPPSVVIDWVLRLQDYKDAMPAWKGGYKKRISNSLPHLIKGAAHYTFERLKCFDHNVDYIHQVSIIGGNGAKRDFQFVSMRLFGVIKTRLLPVRQAMHHT